jgi:hypothetical protein
MTWVYVYLGLIGAPADDAATEFRKRLEKTDPKDTAALLELGDWCESSGRLRWAAKCYSRVVQRGPEEKTYPDASFQLAKIELRRKEFASGYARLRELASRFQHSRAKRLLSSEESAATRKQQALVKSGDASYKSGDYPTARKDFTAAFQLSPDDPGSAPFVPRDDLLRRLARTVDQIDDAHYEKVVKPIARQIVRCTDCKGGFKTCDACGGKGGKSVTRTLLRKGRVTKFHPCKKCNTAGHFFCSSCVGLEHTTDDFKITDKERKTLKDVLMKVRDVKVLKRQLGSALSTVERMLLKVDESATLNLFRAIKPRYTLSKSIRSHLRSTPATSAAVKSAEPVWKSAERDVRVKANFMLSYASEFAKFIEPFDMLHAKRSSSTSFFAPPSIEKPPEIRLTPELLSAFPDQNSGKWVAVDGFFDAYEEDLAKKAKGRLTIRGDIDHNVNFFVWLPTAKGHIQFLGKSGWGSSVSSLSRAYPFDVRTKVASIPTGHRVQIVGRFLRNRLGHPRNWFEVWDVEVGFSKNQEEAYRALSERVEISLPSLAAEQIGSFLRWFDVRVSVKGVRHGTALRCQADGCSVAELIDSIARELGAGWRYADGRVVIERNAATSSDLVAVVGKLRRESSGTVKVERNDGGSPASATPQVTRRPNDLPDDAVSLERLAKAAAREMDFVLAASAWKKLESLPEGKKRRAEIRKERYRVGLFDALTTATPISHLATSPDVTRVVISSSKGGTFKRSVHVLRRDSTHVWVQPSYGGEVRVRRNRIKETSTLTAAQWRAAKRKELTDRSDGLASARPRGKVASLFSLALFAKTNRVAHEGTVFLDEAIRIDEFEWVLETYFADDATRLTRFWKRASGRSDPLGRVAKKPSGGTKSGGSRAGTSGDDVVKLPPITEIPTTEPIPSSTKDLLTFAVKHYSKGREHIRRSLPGSEGAGKHRRRAMDHFTLASQAASKLESIEPGNQAAKALARDSRIMVQTCAKDMGFFD